MISSLYETHRSFFGFLLSNLAVLGDVYSLVLISALSGIVLVFCYKFVSPQQRIASTKRRIFANFQESVLFRHDVRTSLWAQGAAILLSLKYASLAIPALFALAVPAILVLGQLYPSFGLQRVHIGDQFVVTASFRDEQLPDQVDFTTRDLDVTGPVRIAALGEISWRVQVMGSDPAFELRSSGEGQEVRLLTERFPSSTGVQPLWLAWILGAQAPEIATLSSVSIDYVDRTHMWLFIEWNWVILFLVVSLVAGLIFSRVFRVEI